MTEATNKPPRKQVTVHKMGIDPEELNGSIQRAIDILTEYQKMFGPDAILKYGTIDSWSDYPTINVTTIRDETNWEYEVRCGTEEARRKEQRLRDEKEYKRLSSLFNAVGDKF